MKLYRTLSDEEATHKSDFSLNGVWLREIQIPKLLEDLRLAARVAPEWDEKRVKAALLT